MTRHIRDAVSRRPSRISQRAGEGAFPHLDSAESGLSSLLREIWRSADLSATPREAIEILLTFGGRVNRRVSWNAMHPFERAAARAYFGSNFCCGEPSEDLDDSCTVDASGTTNFVSELAITRLGRVVVGTPMKRYSWTADQLVGGIVRLTWTNKQLQDLHNLSQRARLSWAAQASECRKWISIQGPARRARYIERIREAARRTAPFEFYCGYRLYSNFEGNASITGKGWAAGELHCFTLGLEDVDPSLWSDNDVVVITCLHILIESGGFGSIEEVNGLNVDLQVTGEILARGLQQLGVMPEMTMQQFSICPVHSELTPTASELLGLAYRAKLAGLLSLPNTLPYRSISAVNFHKSARVANVNPTHPLDGELAICNDIGSNVPLSGRTVSEMLDGLSRNALWLVEESGRFSTGLEAMIYSACKVLCARLDADFAMSRGTRNLTEFARKVRAREWETLSEWDMSAYYCCVVPNYKAWLHFADSTEKVADTAWAISARMQYNSWHMLPGNFPTDARPHDRDYFMPPSMPDLATFADQRHCGHASAKVRFAIRSPQDLTIAGQLFRGFVDVRLMRCSGEPFSEADLIITHRVSSLVAKATEQAAKYASYGATLSITSFDSLWHSLVARDVERSGLQSIYGS